jgi:hypothetical protein
LFKGFFNHASSNSKNILPTSFVPLPMKRWGDCVLPYDTSTRHLRGHLPFGVGRRAPRHHRRLQGHQPLHERFASRPLLPSKGLKSTDYNELGKFPLLAILKMNSNRRTSKNISSNLQILKRCEAYSRSIFQAQPKKGLAYLN